MGAIKVVLDTNVLLSGLAYPNSQPGKIIHAWQSGGLDLYLSEFILHELQRVLPRLRARHGLNNEEIEELIHILSIQAELLVPLETDAIAIRDQNDRPILGTWLALEQQIGGDYLITGDKDLLVLADQFPILTPADFCCRHM